MISSIWLIKLFDYAKEYHSNVRDTFDLEKFLIKHFFRSIWVDQWMNHFHSSRYPQFIPLVPVHFTLFQFSEGGLRSLWWVGTQAEKWLQEIKRALLRWSTCSHSVHFCLAKCQTQLACTWHDPKSLPFCVCGCVCVRVKTFLPRSPR